MQNSISLSREPTLREASALLADVERELAAAGARVERLGSSALRFDVPPPWRRPTLGALVGVTSGTVGLSAGGGGPWRIRYTLGFRRLYVMASVVTALVAVLARGLPRTTLIVAALACWLVVFGVPWALAARRAHRMVQDAARRVAERRMRPRASRPPEASGGETTA